MPAPMQPSAAVTPPTSRPATSPPMTTTPERDAPEAEAVVHDLDTAEGPVADRNEVRLVGRVSGAPERRSLPSGDELVSLRVVVSRHPSGVDTLDVAVGPAPPSGARPRDGQVGRRLLASAERLEPGDRVEVRGSLRRRWWGTGGVRQSRVEVRAEELAPVEP
jgi:single-strand DNA-binding protein